MPDIVDELCEYGIHALVYDPMVCPGSLNGAVKVGILGLAFKENVRDLRNSRALGYDRSQS